MKRSEMIDEIMCCLLSYSVTYPQYPLEQLKIAAEAILKMQEEKGMLPPEVYEIIPDNESGCADEGSRTMLVYKWDEE